jgi:abelson tyrosine-protein kinase 1
MSPAPSCAFDSDTTPVDEKEEKEFDSGSFYATPFGDLSKWRGRPSVGSGNEGEAKSPSEETSSSLLGSGLDGEEYTHIRMDSPPPLDETLANIKNERRYRMLLQHEFHPSRKFLLVQT